MSILRKKFPLLTILSILLAGMIIFYLFTQNKSLKSQVGQLQIQIGRQSDMIESMNENTRKDLMANVITKIDEDLRDNPSRNIPEETIARIIALSHSFIPYIHIAATDSLPAKKISPERGQLLLLLSTMNIDSGSLQKILFQADFSGADLRNADLSKADLRNANLKGADLQNVNLLGADLSNADLSAANLWGASAGVANFTGANMKRSIMSWADLNGAIFKNANLNGANLTSAQLRRTDFTKCLLQWSDLSGAFLNDARLDSADLTGANLNRTQLDNSTLREAILSLANLSESNFTNANLTTTNLNNALITDKNWLSRLDDWTVTGAEEVHAKYQVIDDPKKPLLYRLKKKD